jgi:hypothetical protein
VWKNAQTAFSHSSMVSRLAKTVRIGVLVAVPLAAWAFLFRSGSGTADAAALLAASDPAAVATADRKGEDEETNLDNFQYTLVKYVPSGTNANNSTIRVNSKGLANSTTTTQTVIQAIQTTQQAQAATGMTVTPVTVTVTTGGSGGSTTTTTVTPTSP